MMAIIDALRTVTESRESPSANGEVAKNKLRKQLKRRHIINHRVIYK